MYNWKNLVISQDTTIRDTIETIDKTSMQIALITDHGNHLMGTVTDGDIRRGILKGVALDSPVKAIMNPNPTVATLNEPRETILAKMKRKRLHQIPLVDTEGRIIGVEFLEEMFHVPEYDNWVILMAGGMGKRLYPLTEDCPKPLLKVGGKPLLETILENFSEYGFRKFYLAVNYKAEMIEEHFGDGSKWGVQIRYIRENKKLGTAGALSLLPEVPKHPIFVMNGDLLTKVNFKQLLDFHVEQRAAATMCVREYDFQVPYGVVKIDKHRLIGIEEKPIHRFFVSAGIYLLEPKALEFIPSHTFFDMPTLFERIIEQNLETAVFPIREYWLDIGRMGDLEKANTEFPEVFG